MSSGKKRSNFPSSPSPAKRTLKFSSPSSSNLDITGFLCHVGEDITPDTGNTYSDIKIKTSKTSYSTVKVMKLGLPTEDMFSKQVNKIITVRNVKEKIDDKGEVTIFFNSQIGSKLIVETFNLDFSPELILTNIANINEQSSVVNVKGNLYWLTNEDREVGSNGRRLRDGIIHDETGSIRISVWKKGDLIDIIKEGTTYIFTDLTTSIFYGLKLETKRHSAIQKSTDLGVEKPNLKEFLIQSKSEVLICCPEFTSACLENTYSCSACHQVMEMQENQKFLRCPASKCKHLQLSSKLVKKTYCEVYMEKNSKKYELELSSELIDANFGNTNDIEQRILDSKNIDIYYDKNTMQITKLENHDTQ